MQRAHIMKTESATFKTLDLPGGTLVPFPSTPGSSVRILYGRVWLTEEGDTCDAFLASGEEVSLHSRGLAVIEALGPARVQWIGPEDAGWKIGERLGKLVARARDWLRRRRLSAECRVT